MAKPTIRFKGYTDDWEQRKLGDVFKEYSEKNHTELPALTIIQGGGTVKREDSDRNLMYDKSNLSNYKMVRKDDFIVHLRSFEGGLEKASSDGIISPAYHTFHSDVADSRFYYPYFRSHEFIKHKLVPHVYGIRDGRSIDIDGMKTIEIPYTSTEEQQKIGDYLESIDHHITLHQRITPYFLKINAFVWEQRKLLEFVSFFNGLTYTPDDVEETGTLVLRSSNVKNGEIVDADNVYVNDKAVTSENVHEGDIIVVVRNGSRALIGKHAQIKAPMPNTVIGAFMSGIRSEHSSFVNALLDTSAFENEIAKNMGATINQITGYMFSKMEFMIPSGDEQQKIGEHFQSLDNLITLHQRKCEETKILKKYMLQKMFPQNGQKVPEIRFKGFTDDWEQRKLGDLVDRVTRKNQDLVSELPLTISAQYGLIDQNEFFDKRVASKDVSGYYLIENGEFAYNKSTSTDAPWGAIKRLDRYENGVLSTLYIVFGIKANNPIDSDFLVSYYSTNLWHKGIHEIAAEGARNHGLLNIAPADFFETKLMIPQDIEEQKKIGKYFEELERLITLHQRKCEELQNIKKFMLQNMFV